MTARTSTWLKDNWAERDPFDYNTDLVDSMIGPLDPLTIGTDGAGEDVIFYGDTSGSQFHWDADTDTLELDGTTPKFRLGDFSGATVGSGSVVSAANSAAFRVYADDGGAAIGSGTLARAGVFRNLLTYTTGNREQEVAGVIGQVVSVAGTNRHNMAGTWGSYEARTSLTVDGQAAATDTWAQAAIIARVGVGTAITTISTNGVLAGVAAMSNTVSFAANSGVYAGYYAGAWSGAIDWGYGLYIEADKVTTAGIHVGSGATHGIVVGEDDSGSDVKFFGATASSYMEWDESADRLNVISAGMTENMKAANFEAYPVDLTHGARQGAVYVYLDRTDTYPLSGWDGNPDCAFKIQARNRAVNTTARGGVRAADLNARCRDSGTLSWLNALYCTTENDGAGIASMTAIELNTKSTAACSGDIIGLRIHDQSTVARGGDHYGLKFTAQYNLTRAYALFVDSTLGTWTNALSLNGNITNVFDFENNDGTNGADDSAACATNTNPSDGAIKIDSAGTSYYVPYFNATHTTNSW